MRELAPELRAIHDLARAAQGAYEVEELLGRICQSVVETFGFERALISRYLPEGREVVPVAGHGFPAGVLEGAQWSIEERPVLRRALESGQAIFIEDVSKDEELATELARALDVRSCVAVPLITEGRCLGFLAADRAGATFRLERDALDLVTIIGVLAAVFLEKALAHDELREVDRLKTNFITLASHELRTPTAVVHGIASTLHLRGHELTPEQLTELRRTLYEQTDRLRLLVDQLLDLSRLEAKGVRIEPQEVPVRRRVEELVRMAGAERAGDVTLDIAPELELLVDPNAFDRIVSNLITNALRYGGPPVTISAAQSDRHFRLTVEDRGRGVAPEFVPHLFERFTRSQVSAPSPEGAGLGLSIAKSYANAHGGDLLYESVEPHGARFQLVLPRQSFSAGAEKL